MNRWLTVAFLVASIGGAFSLYAAISVGSGGLANMAVNLQSLSVVMNNYYLSLNTNRNLVNRTLSDLGYFVNVTFAALNRTYGATQPSLQSLMSSVSYFNQSLGYGEQSVNSQISSDLSQLSSSLQQMIDSIMQSFSMALYTMTSYDLSYVQDTCVARNISQMIQIPNSLSKLGPCLQQEVNTANAITPIIVSTINLLRNDLAAYTNLLRICQPTSPTCIEQFFAMASSDMSQVQSALSMVMQYVNYIQQDVMNRNRMCADLVRADIADATSNLQSAVSSCSYPQM